MTDQPAPETTRATSSLPLTMIDVDGFRGVKNLKLSGLERLNFLVGTGNSGKTSVLEAIACYSHPLDMRGWLKTARFREAREHRFYPMQAVDVLRWLFPHDIDPQGEERHGRISVSAEGSSPIASMEATCKPFFGLRAPLVEEQHVAFYGVRSTDEPLVEDDGWRFKLEAQRRGQVGRDVLSFTAWSNGETELPQPVGPVLKCQLVAPYAHRNQPAQLKGLTRMTMDNQKELVAQLLNDLDPDIVGVEIISEGSSGQAQLSLRHRHSGIVPLHVFGDGLRRALMIALVILQCRGGVMLLDEIEAALHVSAMGKVFPWLERACRDYDVQMIGTTHSLEAIDAVAGSIGNESVAAFHIDGKLGDAKRYSKDMLRRLVHDRGLDIR